MVSIVGQGQEDEDLKGRLYLDLPKTYTKTVDGSGNPIAQDTKIVDGSGNPIAQDTNIYPVSCSL